MQAVLLTTILFRFSIHFSDKITLKRNRNKYKMFMLKNQISLSSLQKIASLVSYKINCIVIFTIVNARKGNNGNN